MFAIWQRRYIDVFTNYPNLFTSLSCEDEEIVSDLFEKIDSAGFLNDTAVGRILERACEDMSGLNKAITLMSYATTSCHSLDYVQKLMDTARVLKNPLCKTIFDARLRCFSDYAETVDPLTHPGVADAIIEQLGRVGSQEEKIRDFFNFFAQYRPFPPSQKYLTEVNMAEHVTIELSVYCNKIARSEGLDIARQMALELQLYGGCSDILNAVKYNVACSIESEDMCSTRNYDRLMNEIAMAVAVPQTTPIHIIEPLVPPLRKPERPLDTTQEDTPPCTKRRAGDSHDEVSALLQILRGKSLFGSTSSGHPEQASSVAPSAY